MLGAGAPPVFPSPAHSSADGLALLVAAIVFLAFATWMAVHLARGAGAESQVHPPTVERPRERVSA